MKFFATCARGLEPILANELRQIGAADVDPGIARFMADSQVPWSVQALEGKISSPAWKTRPSWYLIPQDDRIIPPAAQRAMAGRARATIREIPGSHAVYVANPAAIATLIKEVLAGKRGYSDGVIPAG